MSPEEDRTRDAVDSEPKHYQRAIPAPWVGMTKKEERKENCEEEKEEKRALPKTFYKISLLQREPQKARLFSNKIETRTTGRNYNSC